MTALMTIVLMMVSVITSETSVSFSRVDGVISQEAFVTILVTVRT
jgi:hypothetical protein